MAKTKNIIFDLGGVLLNLDIQKTVDAFKQLGLNNTEELFRVGYAASFFKQHETGSINDEEFIASIEKLTGSSGKQQQITEAWNALLLDFPPERIQWLQGLKNSYRLFLFSNTNAIHLNRFQETFYTSHGFAMDELFEKTYYSHLVRVRKPDIKAYEMVLNENNLEASQTIFIDDALVNVESAESIGIHGIHLKPGVSITSIVFD